MKNCGIVVGATHPDDLKRIREITGTLPFLIPGVGAQGGDLESAVRFGLDMNGLGAIINASRSIIYASQGKDFADKARDSAKLLTDRINLIRTN